MTFKQAHQLLKATGATIRLVPGNAFSALARMANDVTETDLLIIGADQNQAALAKAWFYVPRMLHAHSLVCLHEGSDEAESSYFRIVERDEANRRAGESKVAQRRAA